MVRIRMIGMTNNKRSLDYNKKTPLKEIFFSRSSFHHQYIHYKIYQESLLFLPPIGFVAQLNRASDYGSEGYRFESYRGHKYQRLPKK